MKTSCIRCFTKVAAGLVAAMAGGWATAATFNLNPSADAFVTTGPSGNLATNNYGGAGALSVAAPGLSKGEFQSVLAFNFAGAESAFDSQFGSGAWAIQSITLQLTAMRPNNGIFNSSAAGQFALSLMLNNGWTEGSGIPTTPTQSGITFSTLSNYVSAADESLGTFSFNGATNGTATYTLTLSPTLAADVLDGGIASLRMFAADSSVSYLSGSRDFNSSSGFPTMTITAVPEPATPVLASLALLVTAGRKRLPRRRL